MEKDWLDFEYSNKPVTPFGGMSLMKRFVDKTGIIPFIDSQDLPSPQSNAGYNSSHIMLSFWVSLWIGANRFSHTAILKYDKVLQGIFGWKRCPSDNTYTRFFKKFDLEKSSNFFFDLYSWFFSQLKFDNFTLDVDSSVWTRYGNQEGAAKGYNPKKRGRKSHHPLIAIISDLKMIANFWLRPGNTSSANNVINFLEETIAILKGKTVGLLRADSGFYRLDVIKWLENKGIDYLIAIKMYPFLRLTLKDHVKWIMIDDGIEIGEFNYQGIGWENKRRIVVVRQHIKVRPKAGGKLLFKDDEVYRNYRYSAFCTSLKFSAHDVWTLYRKRADAENRIKELEYDFGSDNFCTQNFYATEATLRTIMVGYNLIALFKLGVLQTKQSQRLSTIRFNYFSIGSWIVKNGRKSILKMSVVMQKRKWLDGIFSESSNFNWRKVKTY
jgi:hypothetical protein